MLKKLAELTVEADGRYATDAELQFIEQYADSLEQRISTYEKVREVEKDVIKEMETKLYQKLPDVFANNSETAKSFCRRDSKLVLRHSAMAMLTGDDDRLRESLLLWQRTIMLAFKMERCNQMIFSELMPAILRNLLTSEEFALIQPALQLNQTVLAY